MRLPAIKGIIDRRILVNFRCDPERIAQVLPEPFRPQIFNGFAIGGICLIRLKNIRPAILPFPWGLGSENAAHRIAVEWDTESGTKSGVFIPRRDTSSRLNSWAGGRVFPGDHYLATFAVKELTDHFSVTMNSGDGEANVHVSGTVSDTFPTSSIFDSLEAASKFFEAGSLGYSPKSRDGRFDGIELSCLNWSVQSLDVEKVSSSFFENRDAFPEGAVEFDCALLMRGIQHRWLGKPDLCCEASGSTGKV